MKSKDYMKKVYRRFSDFIAIAAGRELEYFVLDSKFTSSFNYRMKKLVDELKEEGKSDIEFTMLFNTEGEIAIIDANLIGKYIGNNYHVSIEEYYKNAGLNKIVRDVINGSEKSQKDFLVVSYSVLYKTLDTIYQEIRCKKEIVDNYKNDYMLINYNNPDIGAVIACVLILEDVCKYLGIKQEVLVQSVNFVTINKN